MIREYQEQDLDDLLSVWMAASEIAHPFLTKDFLTLERENIPKVYLPIAETWVAKEEERIVGFISLIGNEIGAIFVHPQHHGRGFGRGLMDKAKELRGELFVEVFAANMNARRFYDKCGFEPIEEKVHEQTGFAIIRLQLPAKKSFSAR